MFVQFQVYLCLCGLFNGIVDCVLPRFLSCLRSASLPLALQIQTGTNSVCVCKFNTMDVTKTVSYYLLKIMTFNWHLRLNSYMHLFFPIEFKCASNGLFCVQSTLNSHHTVKFDAKTERNSIFFFGKEQKWPLRRENQNNNSTKIVKLYELKN